MLKRLSAVAVLLLALETPPCLAVEEGATATALKSITQSMLDAVAPGDRAAWDKHLHPDFVRLDENGELSVGNGFTEEIKPLPPGLEGRMEVEDFTVTVEGNTAVAVYAIQEYLDYHGQALRSRFRSMDTWINTSDGWRLLAQHVAAELKDPPAVSVSQEILCDFEGVYELAAEIRTAISCAENSLRSIRDDRPPVIYLAETDTVFFVSGRPRTRRIFLRDAGGKVSGFVDRREGEDIRWRLVE